MSETATASPTMPTCESRAQRPAWRETLAPYAQPHLGRGLLDLATPVLPYLALSVLMYLALDVSYLLVLVLAIAVPAAGFSLRTYVVFHDCTHGSFLPSKRANAWLGVTLGLIVYSPFASWPAGRGGVLAGGLAPRTCSCGAPGPARRVARRGWCRCGWGAARTSD